jgi:hypothetical protein
MTRSERAQIGEVARDARATCQMDSLSLDASVEPTHGGRIELPLSEYWHSRPNLKYEAMSFPLGFPLRVVSNSPRVLEAADQSWSGFDPVFHGEPLEILLEVRSATVTSEALPPAPAHILQGSLLLQIADVDNFFIADLKRGRAMGRVTPAAVASSRYLRYFFLEGAALSMISSLRAVAVHGACVRANGKGVLLCGDSGEGKSTLAYAGARAGWTYVSDDATYVPVERGDRMAIGNCTQIRFRPSGATLFPELAGRPITPRAAGKPSIEVRTSEWPEIKTANSTPVDHVVFLNRTCADTQELVSLRPSSVLPWFKQHLISPPEMRPEQEATLERILNAGVFELRYHNLGWAIERINELASKGN